MPAGLERANKTFFVTSPLVFPGVLFVTGFNVYVLTTRISSLLSQDNNLAIILPIVAIGVFCAINIIYCIYILYLLCKRLIELYKKSMMVPTHEKIDVYNFIILNALLSAIWMFLLHCFIFIITNEYDDLPIIYLWMLISPFILSTFYTVLVGFNRFGA